MLSGFDLHVAAAVQAFQIHACKIRVFLVQIVPLANSARLAREFLANELFAGISHLPSGFARDVKRFILGRFGDSFDSFSVCGHDCNVLSQVPVHLFHQFFLKMDKTKKLILHA